MFDYFLGAFVAIVVIYLLTPTFFTPARNRKRASLIRRFVGYVMVLGITYGAGLLYYSLGEPHLMNIQQADPAQPGSVSPQVSHLAALVEEAPDNPEHWLNLGIQLRQEGAVYEAVNAFGEAYRLSDKHPEMGMVLLETMILSANGSMSPQSRKLLAELKPAMAESEELAFFDALAMAQDGQHDEALAQWEAIVARQEEGSRLAVMTQHYIDLTRQHLAGDPLPEMTPDLGPEAQPDDVSGDSVENASPTDADEAISNDDSIDSSDESTVAAPASQDGPEENAAEEQ